MGGVLAALLLAAGASDPAPIEAVTLHPFTDTDYMCSEHWEGQLPYAGDALGSDCVVFGGLEGDGSKGGFARLYASDGARNEDWYGWNRPVLAPFDGTVTKVIDNPVANTPGSFGKPPAALIIVKRVDGVEVMLGHLQAIRVKEGDAGRAGQEVARVGNNGFSRSPHVHVGAWKGEAPLQVRWDLRAMGALRRAPR